MIVSENEIMIESFGNKETKNIFNGIRSIKLDLNMQMIARRKLRLIQAARILNDLRIPPGNRLEKLTGNLNGYYSIRINDQYRIIFKWTNGGASDVQITDYH